MNNKPRKIWCCIDCGVEVNRKVKRCHSCNKIFMITARPTYIRTPEHNEMMSKITSKPKPHMVGRKFPHRNKAIKAAWTEEMRLAAKERGEKNAKDPKWLKKIAESVLGDKNPRWINGCACTPYAPGFSRSLKLKIRLRDNFTCRLCNKTEAELKYNLSIHHSDYNKANHSEDNLFATCKSCNSRVNSNRDYWQDYFRKLN